MKPEEQTVEIQFQLKSLRRPNAGATPVAQTIAAGAPRITQVLAMAIHFQDMIERGDAANYADLARLGCLSRERMSQVMELAWLSPSIQSEILQFSTTQPRFPISEVAARAVAGILCWEDQRIAWKELKAKAGCGQ